MKKQTISIPFLAIATVLALSTANAADRKGPPRGGKPPAEAFAACADKSEGDSCSFTGSRGEATGSCMAPPNGDKVLACAPEGGRPPK